jgi:Mrp family chromosome partitioning ATPase
MMVMKAVQQLLFDVDWTTPTGEGSQDLDVLVIDGEPRSPTADRPIERAQHISQAL